ncbi:MAG: DUF934 domain-containing protein [Betaproteobacteria bacterium]|nr:DUF934 domain-containing protein [Betaproteobacteria bacterium]
METLIRNERLASDEWQSLEADPTRWTTIQEDGFVLDFPQDADLIAPLALLRARGGDLLERSGRTGVLLEPGDDPAALAGILERLALVAVRFPKFSDGRGYSSARLLRERYGFRGELRAVGDVLRDQVLFMKRCGFDAFALREDQDAAGALAALDELGEQYQASYDEPQPLFRRRVAQTRGRAATQIA